MHPTSVTSFLRVLRRIFYMKYGFKKANLIQNPENTCILLCPQSRMFVYLALYNSFSCILTIHTNQKCTGIKNKIH